MLAHGARPRQLHWYHAGPMLFGDWGTSRLYVLGLAFYHAGHASFWYMLAMSFLLVAVGWAYSVICRLYPDGGGVYSSARQRSQTLAVVGALLLCADYVVTAALSSLDAFHYLHVPRPEIWAAVSIGLIGAVNFFGPAKAGTGALVVALLTILLSSVVGLCAAPYLREATITAPVGQPLAWWGTFTSLILAISGVEAVANMTGIMVKPVAKTANRAIWPVLAEIVLLNLVLTVAMLAIPAEVLGKGDPALAQTANRDTMLHVIAAYYVGPGFAAVASLVFALLLLSAVNTAVTDLVSIQYMMSRDRELPAFFGGLNRFGMPLAGLVLGTVVPVITVLAFPDVGTLADLYAIGVVGAVAVNLGSCSTNYRIELRWYERYGMMAIAALMSVIWVTIAYEKPGALVFAMTIMAAGLAGRWMAHNRERVREWMLAPVQTMIPSPETAEGAAMLTVPPPRIVKAAAEVTAEAAVPRRRLLAAIRGGKRLMQYAVDQAKLEQAELLVLFVRHIAVPTMGSTNVADVRTDPEAQQLFREMEAMATAQGVRFYPLYCVAWDVADAILETSVTHGVDTVLLGATQRGGLWRSMKGDIIQEVAHHLPERINLVIHG